MYSLINPCIHGSGGCSPLSDFGRLRPAPVGQIYSSELSSDVQCIVNNVVPEDLRRSGNDVAHGGPEFLKVFAL